MIGQEVRSPQVVVRRQRARRGNASIFAGAILLPLGVFSVLAATATSGRGIRWDTRLLTLAERHYQSPLVPRLDLALRISLGVALACVLVVVLTRLARGRLRSALFWAVAVGGMLALDIPLKDTFHRPSLHGDGYSFPSGNAMASAAILSAIAFASAPRWRRATFIAGVPVLAAYGAALVYAWWHYPSDVVAGWCLALAWVTASWLAFRPPTRRDGG